MPQQNFSDKIGKSSSPMIERVIKNNENVQQPVSDKNTSTAYNKQPIKP